MTEQEYRPLICRDCPTFEKNCEGSNQDDCERESLDIPDREKIIKLVVKELRKDDDLLLRVSRGHWEEIIPIVLALFPDKETNDEDEYDLFSTIQTDGATRTFQKDRPDREKIARAFYVFNKWSGGELHSWDDCNQSLYYSEADKIIALFPDELQFNPDYLDFKKGVKATEEIWKVKVEEARYEVEERIYNWGNEECIEHPTCETTVLLRRECDGCWQTLKGD